MIKKDLYNLIKTIVKSDKIKNIEESEWDSLAHLSILMELDKIFPNQKYGKYYLLDRPYNVYLTQEIIDMIEEMEGQ